MGTDIHPAVEVRRDGVWRYARPKEPCSWYYETYTEKEVKRLTDSGWVAKYGPIQVGERRNKWDRCKTRLPDFFTHRNYRHFALLGDVRNGSGFAGVYTHDPIPSISSGRGYPADISREAMAKLSHEHSPGWASLSELQAYDYRIKMTEGGVVDENEFLRMIRTGKTPNNWSGSITGPAIVTLSPQTYANLYESPIDLLQGKEARKTRAYDSAARYHIQASWEQNLYNEVKDIPEQWVPYLEKLIPKKGSADDVRVVFDFDS